MSLGGEGRTVDAEFRLARADDVDAIVALVENAYRGEATAASWNSEAHLLRGPRTNREEVAGYLTDPESRFVLAEQAGRLVGCALIQRRANSLCHAGASPEGEAYFGMFAISPARQSGGLGKAVLAECERQARALWNAQAMVLTVISLREELIGWYERRGFVRTGARQPFPFTPTTGELRRDFDLVVLRKTLG
jgi:ribosomal protein S18 acetylase RimI-like enzyme